MASSNNLPRSNLDRRCSWKGSETTKKLRARKGTTRNGEQRESRDRKASAPAALGGGGGAHYGQRGGACGEQGVSGGHHAGQTLLRHHSRRQADGPRGDRLHKRSGGQRRADRPAGQRLPAGLGWARHPGGRHRAIRDAQLRHDVRPALARTPTSGPRATATTISTAGRAAMPRSSALSTSTTRTCRPCAGRVAATRTGCRRRMSRDRPASAA